MSVTYLLLSPLTEQEMLDLEYACGDALDAWFDDNPDAENDYGEMETMEDVLSLEDVKKAYKKSKLELDDATAERLATCQSGFSIEDPGEISGEGGLQVSILRFLLERAGAGLVSLGGYPFENAEDVLERLRSVPGVDGFAEESAEPKRRRMAQPSREDGQARAERVLRILESAMKNVNQAIDVKNALHRASPSARNYGALLLEEGAMVDVQAAEKLGMDLVALIEAADELDRGLKRR
ncbi:MAG TPA: hypothetical protein PKA88_12945 [Polyangiaceae bacterium]|nr:hypothetical protein [Polyangiaceae bacterium]HMR79242.1 hypothetical protein [Polyangiaceae bacterium]